MAPWPHLQAAVIAAW